MKLAQVGVQVKEGALSNRQRPRFMILLHSLTGEFLDGLTLGPVSSTDWLKAYVKLIGDNEGVSSDTVVEPRMPENVSFINNFVSQGLKVSYLLGFAVVRGRKASTRCAAPLKARFD